MKYEVNEVWIPCCCSREDSGIFNNNQTENQDGQNNKQTGTCVLVREETGAGEEVDSGTDRMNT